MRTPLFKGSFIAVEQDEETGNEIVRAADRAGVLIYVKDLDSVVLVEQYRPAMKDHVFQGHSMENFGGRYDNTLTPAEVMVKEAAEEAGVRLDPVRVVLLNSGKPVANLPAFSLSACIWDTPRCRNYALSAAGGKGFGENQSAILASAKSLHIPNSEQVTTGALECA